MFEKLYIAIYKSLLFLHDTVFGLLYYAVPGIVQQLVEWQSKERFDIELNGKRPHDIVVHDYDEVIQWAATNFPLGAGESYMNGGWDFVDTDGPGSIECVTRFGKNIIVTIPHYLHDRLGRFINRQTREHALEVVEYHYNMGNVLFESFLDKNMQYSCGYWRTANNLEQAQLDKMDLIARKLKLKPGMKLLELGSGFGTLAKHLAENYGVSVVAYNISVDQVEYSRKVSKDLPVDIRVEDYRNATGSYDRVYSIAFFEAVGHQNFKEFFRVVNRCLKKDGLALIHTIALLDEELPRTEGFVDKYVFPNGELPYLSDLISSSNQYFQIEDVHNFGYDYTKTLQAWRSRFVKAWPELKGEKYDDTFYRLWFFYLTSTSACFKARILHLLQVVYTKKDGFYGTYDSER